MLKSQNALLALHSEVHKLLGKDHLEDKYFCDSSPSFAPSSSLFSLQLVIPDWFFLTLVPVPPDVQDDFPFRRTTRLPWATTSGSFRLCGRRRTSSRLPGFLTPQKDACYGWLSCSTSLCARFTFCLVYAYIFFPFPFKVVVAGSSENPFDC